jgi:hypothetical protein
MGQWVASNHNNADEYVGSAWPCVKHLTIPGGGAVTKVEFPSVTQFITFHNDEHDGASNKAFLVSFREDGFAPNSDYFTVHPGEIIDKLSVKCKELWLKTNDSQSVTLDIIAGVTNVPRKNFPNQIELTITVIPIPMQTLVSSEAELLNALLDPTVNDIVLTGDVTIANPPTVNDVSLIIDRPLKISGGALVSEASSDAAITFIRVNSDDVTFENMTIKHRRPAASAGQIDRAVLVTGERFQAINVHVEFMEFGYWMEGSFAVEGGSTKYVGPSGNEHRHFGFFSITGDSAVRNLEFDFPFEATARSVFALSNQSQPNRLFMGKLTLDGVRQKTTSTSLSDPAQYHYMRQFFVQQSFAADPADRTGMALDFRNCSWDDIAGGAFIFNNADNPLSQYDSITLLNNEQGIGTLIDSYGQVPLEDASDPGRAKGLFFVDGSSGTGRPLGDENVLTMSGNVLPGVDQPGDTLRPGFAYLNPAGQQANVFAYNTARYSP